MRILLVQPAPFEPGRIGLENVFWLSEPVALTAIAAMVPEHEVRIMDMRIEEDVALNRAMLEFRPQLVGTTSMTTDCYQAKAVLEIAKGTLGEGCFTLVGGHHPTLAPGDFEDEAVDAICLGEGEETFAELVRHLAGGGDPRALHVIAGLRFRDGAGAYVTTAKRAQRRELDSFPPPARHLVPRRYFREYFFGFLNPLASMETSRGCSFDCNFCAIWEFYERRTRFLSAAAICDRLAATDQRFVFFLDDNFLTKRTRLEELCDELARRRIRKYFAVQGRSDFIADHPDLMRRLRDAGLMMVLSGYESNDDDALDALRKQNTMAKNRRAAEVLRELGIVSVGVFMVRPEFEEAEFDLLYRTINELEIVFPMVSILTPLPGTQLHRRLEGELLTRDTRLFDLLHAVTPTRLPRETFYRKYAEWHATTLISTKRGMLRALRRRPGFFAQAVPGSYRFLRRELHYFPVLQSHEAHLRDEVGIIPRDAAPGRRAAARPAGIQLPVLQEGQG